MQIGVDKMENRIRLNKNKIVLALILLLSGVLNFYNLKIEGFANKYYAAGVRSMGLNIRNSFFVAFDPSGFVSIDKPPVGFWIQELSSKLFGYSGFSLILPQALAGVISVALLYVIVRRHFGSFAAQISALCLSITPVFVAASRNNTIDNILILSMLAAFYAVLLAIEKNKWSYFVLSTAIVGIGFNIKMSEVLLVLPSIYIGYMFCTKFTKKQKVKHFIIATIVLLSVSLSWAFVVDLVPTKDRPFVGSSTNNSVMELILGHNGLERIGVNINHHKSLLNVFKIGKISVKKNNTVEQKNSDKSGNSNKLFTKGNVSDQISWLLPLAIIGIIVAIFLERTKAQFDNGRMSSIVLWGLWLIPEIIYFNFDGSVHTYYMTTMAPAIAALVGIGIYYMKKDYRTGKTGGWILPTAFIINGAFEIYLLSYYYSSIKSVRAIMICTFILSIALSSIVLALNLKSHASEILIKILLTLGFIGLLMPPLVWSASTLIYPMNGSSPVAGLELSKSKQNNSLSYASNKKLINYLESNGHKGEKYILATPTASGYASEIIIETGKSVLAFGGFSGNDNILTVNKFKELIDRGELKYALIGSDNNGNKGIIKWIKENGKAVPQKDWLGNNDSKNNKKVQTDKNNKNRVKNISTLYELGL